MHNMRYRNFAFAILTMLTVGASAQNISYNGPLRPQIHFSPLKNFMNDPNGAFLDADGLWHLYYQYDPTAVTSGNVHWGHATSPDLYTWTTHGIAISPTANTSEQIFSGSAVIDVDNTSGFFPNQTNGVVAIYTLDTPEEQSQAIAYSRDGGYTFEKYAGNPVIEIPGETNFRDPKVIWHAETQKWVMTVSLAQDLLIRFYTSANLRQWELASEIGGLGVQRQYNASLQYECPNLVRVPQKNGSDPSKWILLVSVNPGAPLGGSATEYFPGYFNGTHFLPDDPTSQHQFVDFAKDFYAAQFFYGVPDDQGLVYIGWANNWEYTNLVPTGTLEGWRGAMSLPRSVALSPNNKFIQRPYKTLSGLVEREILTKDGSASLKSTDGTIFFTGTDSTKITFENSQGEAVEIGFHEEEKLFYVNRFTDGFEGYGFTKLFNTTVPEGVRSFEGVFDRSMVEVFLNGGEKVGTTVFYPVKPLDRVVISGGAGAAWALRSTWRER